MADPVAAPDLLSVVCGNSTTSALHHGDGARLSLSARAPDLVRLRGFLADHPAARCIVASVAPAAYASVEGELAAAGRVVLAGRDLRCPLPLAYATPETLGVDRWLSALAAHRRFGRAVVVDCGSATTVNLVEADGTFRGGAIAPGLAAFVAGMAAVTPGLPCADLDAAVELPASSSQSSVDAGVLLGYCGLVERLVAAALRAAGGPARLVVTGGNALRLSRHGRLRAVHEPDLVHLGLRELILPAAPPGRCLHDSI